ncbi:uncharacterized protein ASPGLDRAFT_52101 [Aspergillus glaucus CBS 516.65]|uniref:Uncharacterized protein n=1 Tax=Aspergillus glaucus CBS 516.65 TaxID=1160497 RepID=A0A1L9V7H6_ASPGL|nr:hypothetical protein ASPGLDRAFT_52101 [Aspergillus glaucus CBS 516.65]OJJ79870.1 hypothetical protein ASPGLDRAFT_52101 [Aspergillus glaucus CBS 516.65]
MALELLELTLPAPMNVEGEISVHYSYLGDSHLTEPSSEVDERINNLRQELDRILGEHGIPVTSVDGHVVTGPPTGDEPHYHVHVSLRDAIPFSKALDQMRNSTEVLFENYQIDLYGGRIRLQISFRPVIFPTSQFIPLKSAKGHEKQLSACWRKDYRQSDILLRYSFS